jgi:uncharacterized BrkB/YihY/UPF0761 family membrane protein
VSALLVNHPHFGFLNGTYWLLIPLAAVFSIASFFLIYWILPNRKDASDGRSAGRNL